MKFKSKIHIYELLWIFETYLQILNKIFRFLDTKNLFTAAQVCEQWQAVSELSMSRRIYLTKHMDKKIQRQCENCYKLKIDDRETVKPEIQIYEKEIGVLTSRGIEYYRDSNRNSNRELLCREAFLYLPRLKWAQNVTLLELDVPNLSSRDVNEVAPLLLKQFKSLNTLKIIVNWSARKTAAGGRGGAAPTPSEFNTSMKKLKVAYEVEADERRRKISKNVFVNVTDFVAICPELEVLMF